MGAAENFPPFCAFITFAHVVFLLWLLMIPYFFGNYLLEFHYTGAIAVVNGCLLVVSPNFSRS